MTRPPDLRPRTSGAASRPGGSTDPGAGDASAITPMGRARDLGWGARTRTTAKADGDFAIDGDRSRLDAARRAVVDLPWVWLRQVHGAQVRVVTADDVEAVRGADGDALVTAERGLVLAAQTADCVPVVLASPEGVIGVAHAGWRGIEAGVVEATVAAMRELGASALRAEVGPRIGVECYEFGADDLDRLVSLLGAHVEGRTSWGARGLDTHAAVDHILGGLDVEVVGAADRVPASATAGGAPGACTGCRPADWFSHRSRGETGRMATVIWREP